MDALEFIKEAKRMCESYEECEACPANADGFDDCRIDHMHDIDAENAVNIVEKWAKEHPKKTRQSVFLEQWPEAEIDKFGCLEICPKHVSADYRSRYVNCTNRVCGGCSREFWMQEVE
jgi:hypothetical protein